MPPRFVGTQATRARVACPAPATASPWPQDAPDRASPPTTKRPDKVTPWPSPTACCLHPTAGTDMPSRRAILRPQCDTRRAWAAHAMPKRRTKARGHKTAGAAPARSKPRPLLARASPARPSRHRSRSCARISFHTPDHTSGRPGRQSGLGDRGMTTRDLRGHVPPDTGPAIWTGSARRATPLASQGHRAARGHKGLPRLAPARSPVRHTVSTRSRIGGDPERLTSPGAGRWKRPGHYGGATVFTSGSVRGPLSGGADTTRTAPTPDSVAIIWGRIGQPLTHPAGRDPPPLPGCPSGPLKGFFHRAVITRSYTSGRKRLRTSRPRRPQGLLLGVLNVATDWGFGHVSSTTFHPYGHLPH